jgi:site-specific DNA-methyltransferase (adenine-specific)
VLSAHAGNASRWASEMANLYNRNCLEVMREMPAESVDCIVSDPPYGIAFQSNAAKKNRYDVIQGDYDFDLAPFFAEMLRVVKEGGAIYLYTRWDIAYQWQKIIEPDSQIIIPRGRVGMGDLDDYADEYEVVLFKRVGNHAINATALKIPNNSHAKNPPKYKVRIGNIWSELVSNEAWERAEHPTQKTVSSFAKMIQVSTNIGATVFDPFMGSGSSGVACVQHGRSFIGCEIDPKYFAVAERRIKQAEQQPSLWHEAQQSVHLTASGAGGRGQNPLQSSFIADDPSATIGGR